MGFKTKRFKTKVISQLNGLYKKDKIFNFHKLSKRFIEKTINN